MSAHIGTEYCNGGEFSFVGMNTNLAQLIANLPTKYYGYNTSVYFPYALIIPAVYTYLMNDLTGTKTTNTAFTTQQTNIDIYYPEVVVVPVPNPPLTSSSSSIITSTASTTFKLRAGGDQSGVIRWNGSNGAQFFNGTLITYIRIIEVQV